MGKIETDKVKKTAIRNRDFPISPFLILKFRVLEDRALIVVTVFRDMPFLLVITKHFHEGWKPSLMNACRLFFGQANRVLKKNLLPDFWSPQTDS